MVWGYASESLCSEEGKGQVPILGQMLALVLRLSGFEVWGPLCEENLDRLLRQPHPGSRTVKTREIKSQQVQSSPG